MPRGSSESAVAALAQALARVGDPELLVRLERLVSRRGQMTAELLVHLGEVDRRKLYLGEACSSMHGYCTARLHLSEAAAYRHIRAARLGRQYPLLLELVAAGEIHLTAVCLLSPHLTAQNHRQLLEAAVHKTKREVELLIAERFPQSDAPSELRKLPGPRRRSDGAPAERAACSAGAANQVPNDLVGKGRASAGAANQVPSDPLGKGPGSAAARWGGPAKSRRTRPAWC